MEENPVWAEVNSLEFDSQFLHHEVPAVVNIATLAKQAHIMKEECKELTEKLGQLREDQHHNQYIPAELFRFIEDLQREVDILRSDVLSLRAENVKEVASLNSRILVLEAEAEEAKTLKVEAFQFDILSAPQETTVTKEGNSCTISFSGTGSHHFAISSIPLDLSRPSQWQVDIVNLPDSSSWAVLGIIGNLHPAYPYFYDVSCFGWGCGNNVWVAGSDQRGRESWTGWKNGDRGVFTFSPMAATLSLQLLRDDGVQQFSIDNCSLPDNVYIHCNFFINGITAVRFSKTV